MKNPEGQYEKGVRAYLVKEQNGYRLIFNHTKQVMYEGIFFKEHGTDFNNGVFKFMKDQETLQVQVHEDIVNELTNVDIDTNASNDDDYL